MKGIAALMPYFGRYRKHLAAALSLAALETVMELVIPYVMSDVIDLGAGEGRTDILLSRGLLMALLAVLSYICGLGYARFISRAAYGFGANIREAEYAAVQELSVRDLERFGTSSLITRMTSDATVMQNLVINGFRPILRAPLMMVLGIFFSFAINARLSVIFLVQFPLLMFITLAILRRIGPRYLKMQRTVDRVNRIVRENVAAVRTVKACVREREEQEKFGEANETLSEAASGAFGLVVLNRPCFEAVFYSSVILILIIGGRMIMQGTLRVGALTGILTYILQVLNSVKMISNVSLRITRALSSSGRIREVLDAAPEIRDAEDAEETLSDGSVRFEHVTYRYGSSAGEVLSDISFEIADGQTVGLLGPTGSGKSTLVHLIPRLLEAGEGTVYVGGTDVKGISRGALRREIALVLQKDLLFSGTVRDNLLWGDEDADDETLYAALRLAGAEEFVRRLPGKLDTVLGQAGVNLSGGQKQRLCLARAVLKRPKLLILDDALSAVDGATDELIRSGLKSLTGMTKLIISQRAASVREADRILILEDGRLKADGRHEDLIRESGLYREILRTQEGGAPHGQIHEA